MTEGSISTTDLPSYVLDCLYGSFGEETIYRMMITFETKTVLVNFTMKLTVTAGLFLIDTCMPVMIKVTA